MTTSSDTHTRPPRAPRLAALTLGVLGLLAIAACGSDGDGDGAAAAEDSGNGATATGSGSGSEDAALDFYQCLRDNGIDVDDPGQPGAIALPDMSEYGPEGREIVDECRSELAGSGMMGDPDNMADTASLIDFTTCMRDNGVDMDDPSPAGELVVGDDFDPASPEFDAARQECAHLLDGGVRIVDPNSDGPRTAQDEGG